MPEEQGSGAQEGAQGQQGSESQGQSSQEGSQGTSKTFTEDEVRQLRAQLNSEAKGHRERAEALQAELNELKKGQMTDSERLAAESKEKDARIAELEGTNRDLRIEGKVIEVARDAKAIDPVVVFKMLDRSKVRFKDGEPSNLDELVAKLKEDHPLLFQRIEGSADQGARQESQSSGGSMNDLIRGAAARKRGG